MGQRSCPYNRTDCTGVHNSHARKDEMCPGAYQNVRQKARRLYAKNPRPAKERASKWRVDNPEKAYCARVKNHAEIRSVVWAIKLDRGCVDCGYNVNPVALDFDHRPGTQKSFNISQAVSSKSLDLILTEIEKCDVRCANCHRIITHERRMGR